MTAQIVSVNLLINGSIVQANFVGMQDCCGVQIVSYKEAGKPTRYGTLELDEDGKRVPVRNEQDLLKMRKLGVVAALHGLPARS